LTKATMPIGQPFDRFH
jgi:DnaJ-class molecular chaperone